MDPAMKIGYTRVSTQDRNAGLQVDALRIAGCICMFQHTASGAGFDQPGLTGALETLEEGDTLVVWKLDRLGRSVAQALLDALRGRGIAFQ